MIKKVFLIGGMSESGKSSLGKYFDLKGIKRLKIISFLKNVMQKEGGAEDFHTWNEKNVKERPEWVYEVFTNEFLEVTSKEGVEFCVLESLYNPDLALYMKKALGNHVAIVIYVNMGEDIRLQRQMIRQNLSNIEEAKSLLLPRDKMKREWGVPQIEPIADHVIDNSGTIQELYNRADEIINKECPGILLKVD